MFAIEDDLHAELEGKFPSYEEAFAELERRSQLPWNEPPNQAPCVGWPTCGRIYEIVEYDSTCIPWIELRRVRILDISSNGVKWLAEPELPNPK